MVHRASQHQATLIYKWLKACTRKDAGMADGQTDSLAGFYLQGEEQDKPLGSSEKLEGFVMAALRIL